MQSSCQQHEPTEASQQNLADRSRNFLPLGREGRQPSSKLCSVCDHELDALPLAVRDWTCPRCGTKHNRDVNAALNLKNMAVSSTASACGEEGSGHA